MALALYNVRLFESLSQLNETGKLLTQRLDQEQALQATAKKIKQATKKELYIELLGEQYTTQDRFVGIGTQTACARR